MIAPGASDRQHCHHMERRRVYLSRYFPLVTALLGLASCTQGALSQDTALIEQGQRFAIAHCARCHGIGPRDESPLGLALPFRRLHERYPVEHLAEAFAQGIVVGHSEMPAFELDPAEIEALLAYLKSLEGHR